MLALRLHVDPGDERVRLAAAKDGDADALTWLVRRWTPGVYRFVFRMLNNEEDARDITQETFTRAIRNLNRYDIKRPFSTWVYRIARNACIDKM